jgi:hypothetical protein
VHQIRNRKFLVWIINVMSSPAIAEPEGEAKKSDSKSVTESVEDSLSSDTFANALLTSAEDKEGNDVKYITTRKELWSYYAYYVGNSGLGE